MSVNWRARRARRLAALLVPLAGLLGAGLAATTPAVAAAPICMGTAQGLPFGQTGIELQDVAVGPGYTISCGAWTFTYGTDGNVSFREGGSVLWATNTAGRPSTTFAVQADGNMVLYNGAGVVWQSGTAGTPNAKLTGHDYGEWGPVVWIVDQDDRIVSYLYW